MPSESRDEGHQQHLPSAQPLHTVQNPWRCCSVPVPEGLVMSSSPAALTMAPCLSGPLAPRCLSPFTPPLATVWFWLLTAVNGFSLSGPLLGGRCKEDTSPVSTLHAHCVCLSQTPGPWWPMTGPDVQFKSPGFDKHGLKPKDLSVFPAFPSPL